MDGAATNVPPRTFEEARRMYLRGQIEQYIAFRHFNPAPDVGRENALLKQVWQQERHQTEQASSGAEVTTRRFAAFDHMLVRPATFCGMLRNSLLLLLAAFTAVFCLSMLTCYHTLPKFLPQPDETVHSENPVTAPQFQNVLWPPNSNPTTQPSNIGKSGAENVSLTIENCFFNWTRLHVSWSLPDVNSEFFCLFKAVVRGQKLISAQHVFLPSGSKSVEHYRRSSERRGSDIFLLSLTPCFTSPSSNDSSVFIRAETFRQKHFVCKQSDSMQSETQFSIIEQAYQTAANECQSFCDLAHKSADT